MGRGQPTCKQKSGYSRSGAVCSKHHRGSFTIQKSANGSSDLLVKAMRRVFKEEVQEGSQPTKDAVEGLNRHSPDDIQIRGRRT